MVRLSWQVTAIVLAVLGGSTFLGYEHILVSGTVASIYSAILGGILVGHFTTKNGGPGNGGTQP